jgi:oxalate decarboxylase/phosphoglucose isomerase-like protein (cupin superfamily)
MIDLQTTSGLPLYFDEVNEKFRYGEGIVFQSLNKIPLSSMLPGLLNKSLKYPETVYLEHRDIRHEEDESVFSDAGFHFDVLMLPSGLMGVEFIRSHIFHSPKTENCGSVAEIVESLSGVLTVLLQRNEPKDEWSFETNVSEGLVVRLKAGEKFVVPKGYYYTFINTRVKPVVFSRFYADDCTCDYSQFKREQGLAYFAIRKNAKQEIVLNPRYRGIPEIKKVDPKSMQYSVDVQSHLSEEPLYLQVKNQFKQFNLLF